jgi:DNA repair protein SbcC/Rad50
MIPLELTISGFLSYRNPVKIDLSAINLACISGPNGAGKSSLLDAVTWALFGQARKRDDSVINTQSTAAVVGLVFSYEGNTYRVGRSKVRDKSAMLEFHILQSGSWKSGDGSDAEAASWKSLTEHTLRSTEACIQSVLKLEYETFVNASFFLQGKADQFTQQRPGDRKRILSSILGLDDWEVYRQQTAERRRDVDVNITSIDGRLAEIQAELSEEEVRKSRLQQLEVELKRLSQVCAAQEKTLEVMKKAAATLSEQGRLVENLHRQLEAARQRLGELEEKAAHRRQEHDQFTGILERAPQIEALYQSWQDARQELERWDQVAGQFREHEKRRQGPLSEISEARVRLDEQLQSLRLKQAEVEKLSAGLADLEKQLEQAQTARQAAEAELEKRAALEEALNLARQRQADARAENPRLKQEMDDLKERIDRLSEAEGANCPICGQALSQEERHKLIESLTGQGKELGDRYRKNQRLWQESDQIVADLEAQIRSLGQVEAGLRVHIRAFDQINDRLESDRKKISDWEAHDLLRLREVESTLAREDYALEARRVLLEVDAELKAIGYDAAAHDAVRRAELSGRESESELRELERARAALEPLARELSDLQTQIEAQAKEVSRQQQDFEQAEKAYKEAQAQAPDVDKAEKELLALEEQENHLRLEVGASRQKVEVLKDLKKRHKELSAQREVLGKRAGQYRQLERAFGKDGVPALLIEQALPEIESKANDLLDRLSGGSMSVRFVTQAAYKDKRREDLKETLDIQISDGVGTRDYEMFSGGEAFRVNFAIRLALSEVLAQRAGARLQTLVIDEGFGSQDMEGRQRLIEAINLVKDHFAKILVITHIDELKDAFPARIEVEKTSRGSHVQVT